MSDEKPIEMTKLRIVSDGTPMGTYVTTSDGKRVENIISAQWWCYVDYPARATLTIQGVECDVAVDEDRVISRPAISSPPDAK